MYKYKRGISNLEIAKNIEYCLSNNLNTCLSMSGTLDAKKIYNGMYIKNGKIMLENMVEKFEIKDKVYKVVQLNTKMQSISSDELLSSIDLEKNMFEYDLENIKYTKRIGFEDKSDTLCIEYDVINKSNNTLHFSIIPLLTYRDLLKMKSAQAIKFTQRKIKYGAVINLSVMDSENIIISSKDCIYAKDQKILNNVKHEFTSLDMKKEIFTEDLFIPGVLETKIKANSRKKVDIYISTQELLLDDIRLTNIFSQNEENDYKTICNIDKAFIELKDLAMSISKLEMEQILVPSLPYEKDLSKMFLDKDLIKSSNTLLKDIEKLTDIVRAIDGEYLTFSKVKEAKKVLVKVRRYIKVIDEIDFEDINVIKKIVLLKLWYVESVNRILQKDSDEALYEDFVKDIIYGILNSNKKEEILIDIETVSLMYNGIKIYIDILASNQKQDLKLFEEAKKMEGIIKEKFWVEEKNIMRFSLNEEDVYASAEMIYTLALTHPCIVEDIAIKLLDTIFKELYTSYGLRKVSKSSPRYDSNIYPKYMAYFVKANLRQNGVTRASQKIAFNLVKDLLQDISKHVNGGIKKIYNDKGVAIDSNSYDLLTNAEVIRLYDMLS
ncbi:MAG: glycogen debranching enzyme N-terminal domain-containing protein [Clostridia bacterium]